MLRSARSPVWIRALCVVLVLSCALTLVLLAVPTVHPVAYDPRASAGLAANALSPGRVITLTSADGAAADAFGSSVAMSGDTLIVGAPGHNSSRGAVYVRERNAGGLGNWGQTFKLVASDAADGDAFGTAVAIDGDTIVVGAPGDDDGGDGSGSAYVFARNTVNPNQWDPVAKRTASDGAAGDRFGGSVAVSGDTLVAGAKGHASGAGSAYVFARGGGGPGAWGEVARLSASDGEAGDTFGAAVATYGDYVLIGAPAANYDAGATYVFARDQGGPGAWGQAQTLTPDAQSAGDFFGASVAIWGDTVVVGEPADWQSVVSDFGAQGAADIFQRSQGGTGEWALVRKITASDGRRFDQFGASVAMHEDTVVVTPWYSASSWEPSDRDAAAYVFSRDEGGPGRWNQLYQLRPGVGTTGEALRMAGPAAVYGDAVAVGAPHATVTDHTEQGLVYLFEEGGEPLPYDGWVWNERQTLSASDGESGDGFGSAIAASGDHALVGAPYDDDRGTDAGAAYVFVQSPTGQQDWLELRKLTGGDSTADCHLGWAVAIDGDTAAITGCGSTYVFRRDVGGADNWGQVAKVAVTGNLAISGDTLAVGDPSYNNGPTQRLGRVYIFERNQGGVEHWGQVAEIPPPSEWSHSIFGRPVAIYGDTLAVGWLFASSAVGSVHIYSRNQGGDNHWGETGSTSAWAEAHSLAVYETRGLVGSEGSGAKVFQSTGGVVAELTTGERQGSDQFGASAGLGAYLAAVGAPGYDVAAGFNQGAELVFARDHGGPGQWGLLGKAAASDGVDGDSFGREVALSANSLLIGPSWYALQAGKEWVYAFDLTRLPVARVEAEDGALDSPMTVGFDTGASHGRYVFAPQGSGTSGQDLFTVYVPAEGDYTVWARVWGEGTGADSFFVSVDDAPWVVLYARVGEWAWETLADPSSELAIIHHLGVGWHNILVRTREAGTRLDMVEVRVAEECATPTPTATSTVTQTPTRTSTSTPSPTPTNTATATPPGDLTLSGRVYDAAVGPLHGIPGATVSAIMCLPHAPFQATSGSDGSYSMLLPGLYLNQCISITLEARAAAYQTLSFEIPVADLSAQPVQDLALIPLPTPTATVTLTPSPRFSVYMPVVIRRNIRG